MSTRIPPPPNYESNTPSLASGDDKDSMYSTGNEQPFTQSIPYRDSKFIGTSNGNGNRTTDPSPVRKSNSLSNSISFHIYKASAFSTDQNVMADDKSTILFKISNPRSLVTYELKVYGVASNGEKDKESGPISQISKGAFGFSSNDVRIEINKTGFVAVLYSTGVNFDYRDFIGLGPDGDKFRWGKQPNTENEIECLNLSNGEIVAQWRRTSLAAKKSGELVLNKNYEKDFDLIFITLLGFEEWRREQALLFKADGGAAL